MTLDSSSLRDSAIFAHNPFPAAGNGSLWTIGKEFACYILVAIFGLFCLFKRRFLVLLMTTVVFLIYAEGLVVGADVTYFQTRFLTYYLIGMLAWLWRDKVPFSATFALACLITLLATVWFSPWFQLFFPFAASYLVLWLGFAPRLGFLNWTRKTDISYGTYLYAWPVQQIVAMNQSLRNPWANFLIATPIILLLAWFSWILVEKRFLALKTFSDLDFDPALPIEKSATKGGTYMLPAKR
jgi:peptidoglycan/LPS O-acetylase OafA/YrhL